MLIQSLHRNRTSKEVTMLDAANDSDDALILAAQRRAGESHQSLFGCSVKRYADGGAIVTLHTD